MHGDDTHVGANSYPPFLLAHGALAKVMERSGERPGEGSSRLTGRGVLGEDDLLVRHCAFGARMNWRWREFQSSNYCPAASIGSTDASRED